VSRRVTSVRHRRSWLVSGLVVVLAVAAGGAWLLLGSSVFTVRRLVILGTHDEPVAEVLAAAAVPPGSRMLGLDLDGITRRVAALPRVARVEVERDWPSSLLLRVQERMPVAVTRTTEGLRLVDATGLAYLHAPVPLPPGLPELTAPVVSPQDDATRAELAVLAALPAALRSKVLAVSATGSYDVTLTLTGHRTVRWGAAAEAARKAQVLGVLLSQPGTTYDVSAPDLPTIAGNDR